ncbi:MAG: ribonuclease HI [Nitrososphaera sp.]
MSDAIVEVYFDGLCLPKNPGGIACYAYLIKQEGRLVHSDSGVAAEPMSAGATNNVAEYTALIRALEWLDGNGYSSHRVEVRGDSQLVVSQMNGEYRVKNNQIIPLFQKAALLKKKFRDISITWVPRKQNSEADKLSERAYNNALLENPSLLDKIK